MVTSGRAPVGDLELAYETFGSAGDPAVVLVMGLGTQMLGWPDEFCRSLADQGFHVIRFDNRDIGGSTHLDDLDVPPLWRVLLHRTPPPYRLAEMAGDLLGLLDHLGLDRVHLVGASMGGFIAQLAAIAAPHRFASLTLIMTSTGSRRVGHPHPRAGRQLLRRRPVDDRAGAIEASVQTFAVIGSPGFPAEPEYFREVAGRSYDRGYDPAGVQRQFLAVAVQTDRSADLRRLRIPTLVIHGLADPLVSPSGGLALARTIPGAVFLGFPGMGHDLPRPLWPRLVREIAEHARSAARRDQPG